MTQDMNSSSDEDIGIPVLFALVFILNNELIGTRTLSKISPEHKKQSVILKDGKVNFPRKRKTTFYPSGWKDEQFSIKISVVISLECSNSE